MYNTIEEQAVIENTNKFEKYDDMTLYNKANKELKHSKNKKQAPTICKRLFLRFYHICTRL